ncbi:histidine kinase [Geomonas sp.]|uniref:histidine kinase n=1 Tax=Geomonas sp. TaxID=2651584 RepID=UPI002B494F2F|nr:histidine kinase [Geomonas sp.]HJV34378.1 histidine kinase [Geomonas sp.]
MSLKKTMLAVAAVGAVSAATAVPAMALENEFHGMFRLRAFVSNFDDSGSGAVAIGKQPGSVVINSVQYPGGRPYNNPPTYTYVEQRARLMYIAKANDDLRLVTHFEFDSRWGDNSYNSNAINVNATGGTALSSATRNNGGGIGADQTNLETKNIYLDFKIPSTPVRVKAGIQGWTDNYKGIIFNNDAAGVTAVAPVGPVTIKGAYFRFDDGTGLGTAATTTNGYFGADNAGTPLLQGGGATTATFGATGNAGNNQTVGFNTRDFYTIGAQMAITKQFSIGADYHLLYSDIFRKVSEKTMVQTVGINSEAKFGPATVNGFFLYQFGRLGLTPPNAAINGHQSLSAWSANLAGKMPVGPGTLKLTALALSGDKNTSTTGGMRTDFQTIMERGTTTSGHTFYEANSQILLRNIYATAQTDRAVVFDLNNNGRGIVTAFAGYDLPIGKFFANTNVGIGCVYSDNPNSNNGGIGAQHGNIMGYEFNTELGYKLYDNMTASFAAAYMVLGNFYDTAAGKPDNPYSTKIMLNYTF